jgi:nitroreductase
MNLETVNHLLTTTRTVRKRLDVDRPVEMSVITECLKIAIQAPTGSNAQGWRFLVITDAAKRQRIGELYRESFLEYARSAGEQPVREGGEISADPAQTMRVVSSAFWLAENMHRVPVLILPCVLGRVENAGPMAQASLYGSILPATWSLMLALRARGLGSAWTTLHLRYEQEVADLLAIPAHVTQAALLPVAYFTGDDFRPARRVPADQVTYLEQWGAATADGA